MVLSDGRLLRGLLPAWHKKNSLRRRSASQFHEIAPILRTIHEYCPQIEAKLIHTGEHYDYSVNQSFFEQLEIPEPDISLQVGCGSHAVQTAKS